MTELSNIKTIPICASDMIGACIFKAFNKMKHQARTQPETTTHDAGVLQQIQQVPMGANILVRFHAVIG